MPDVRIRKRRGCLFRKRIRNEVTFQHKGGFDYARTRRTGRRTRRRYGRPRRGRRTQRRHGRPRGRHGRTASERRRMGRQTSPQRLLQRMPYERAGRRRHRYCADRGRRRADLSRKPASRGRVVPADRLKTPHHNGGGRSSPAIVYHPPLLSVSGAPARSSDIIQPMEAVLIRFLLVVVVNPPGRRLIRGTLRFPYRPGTSLRAP